MTNIQAKQGKVILLMGCPRSGKTTLAVKLVKSGKNFSRLSGDHLNIFVGDAEIQRFDFLALIEELIGDSETYGINTVFDCSSYVFPLEAVESLPLKNKVEIFFLGFPNIAEEELRHCIKYYAKPSDWIYDLSEERLAQSAKHIYDFNIKLKSFCEQHGYRFIDMGVGEDRDATINMLFDEIVKKVL